MKGAIMHGVGGWVVGLGSGCSVHQPLQESFVSACQLHAHPQPTPQEVVNDLGVISALTFSSFCFLFLSLSKMQHDILEGFLFLSQLAHVP